MDQKVSPKEESRTVFVSNLSFDTTVEAVKAALEGCGTIDNARLVPDFKGRSKGFGYITFVSSQAVAEAIKRDRVLVDKRPMFISNYETDKTGHKFQYSNQKEKDKLFVKGLPYSMSEQDIKEVFQAHAPVTEIRLVTQRNGYSKGICFIKFANAKDAECARKAMDQTELKGFVISVMISNPSEAKKPNNPYVEKPNPNKPDTGARKSKLSFMPRSVAKKDPPTNASAKQSDDKPKSNDDFRKFLQ